MVFSRGAQIVSEFLDLCLPNLCLICKQLSPTLCCTSCLESIPKVYHRARAISGVDTVVTLSEYTGVMSRLIHYYKLDGYSSLSHPLGHYFLPELSATISDQMVLVPVPSHYKRYKKRGFDHLSLLFLPFLNSRSLSFSSVLTRSMDTPPLYGLSKSERQMLLRHVICPVSSSINLESQHVVLCDDILTTGSTVSACARVCRDLGATTVDVVTFSEVYDD